MGKMSDWRQWKPGDKLSVSDYGRQYYRDSIWNVVSVDPTYINISSEDGRNDYCSNINVYNNPGTCFFFLTPTPTYKPGDRVIREPVDIESVAAGTLGTVITFTGTGVEIHWDGRTHTDIYSLPQRSAYFSLTGTGQRKQSGLHCERCKEFNEYADTVPYKCWQCRADPWR